MSDAFVEIILAAIREVDTSKVWIDTQDVGTCVRGRLAHVFDVTRAMFLHAARSGQHVVFNATYSIGCPGDNEADVFMAEDDTPLNREPAESIEQRVAATFALYPMGGGDYMELIYAQIEAMKQAGIEVNLVHYATRLDGDARRIFDGLERVMRNMEASGSPHTVMTVTISANSPSERP